jgi:hypothetical protein
VSVNTRSKISLSGKTAAHTAMLEIMPIMQVVRTPLLTRSKFPAPTFWPTNVVTAAAKLMIGRNANASIFCAIVNPAVNPGLSAFIVFTRLNKNMKPSENSMF